MEIFDIFNTSRFMPRDVCGNWTPALIYFHNVSDFFIWAAYVAIPVVLLSFAYRRRGELPFQQLFWLFGLFIVACGTTHLMDIVLFYKPLYTLSGWIKLITAAASWGTVIALFHVVPRALLMQSPEKLEHEIQERTAQLQAVNAQLAQANEAKDELLRREQQALRESEDANRAKDAFLAAVSHELRTPLTSMLGWASLMNTYDVPDAPTVHKAMTAIERNARSQSQIIDDLLDVSRIVAGKMSLDMRPLEVAPIVEAALDTVHPAAQAKSITINTDLGTDTPPGTYKVSGDAARIQQTVWNLVSNAVKFTPRGGNVWVGLAREESCVVITVRDDGQGIEPQFLPHVFERFRQADGSSTRRFGGLGLGLSIARHLVEMHGGTIEAQSAGEGQGSTLIVRLPVLAIDDAAPGTNAAPDAVGAAHIAIPPTILRGLRLLVVEDDADAQQMIIAVLERFGANVSSADDAETGFEMLRRERPDVLISDIGLPIEDGYSLMARIRDLPSAEGGRTPAAALTAFAGPNDRLRALAAGFQVHLAKPVQTSELVVAVAGLAGRSINRVTSYE